MEQTEIFSWIRISYLAFYLSFILFPLCRMKMNGKHKLGGNIWAIKWGNWAEIFYDFFDIKFEKLSEHSKEFKFMSFSVQLSSAEIRNFQGKIKRIFLWDKTFFLACKIEKFSKFCRVKWMKWIHESKYSNLENSTEKCEICYNFY